MTNKDNQFKLFYVTYFFSSSGGFGTGSMAMTFEGFFPIKRATETIKAKTRLKEIIITNWIEISEEQMEEIRGSK